jgi:hypothetical protein
MICHICQHHTSPKFGKASVELESQQRLVKVSKVAFDSGRDLQARMQNEVSNTRLRVTHSVCPKTIAIMPVNTYVVNVLVPEPWSLTLGVGKHQPLDS